MKEIIKDLWSEFKIDLIDWLKIAAIVIGLFALFAIAASACSPVLEQFDRVTGYLP